MAFRRLLAAPHRQPQRGAREPRSAADSPRPRARASLWVPNNSSSSDDLAPSDGAVRNVGIPASAGGGSATGSSRPTSTSPLIPPDRCVREGGMSLHADVAVPARNRKRLERLCRYVARPPIAIERLAPLIPPPRAHQVRYHGLLAPCASGRDRVVPRPLPYTGSPNIRSPDGCADHLTPSNSIRGYNSPIPIRGIWDMSADRANAADGRHQDQTLRMTLRERREENGRGHLRKVI